jgi:hypothetical protein
MTNRLRHETSPYLLQHAENPVDWYPWGEEALDKAKTEDKPIFLSIGYSACHWCHVMEHECFENNAIADLMNQLFINIKVDREERPDLDELYMNAVQALTGAGGWPMSVFLTPELQPFYGGTYFPPTPVYGRPSFPQVLEGVSDAFHNQREQIDASAQTLTRHIQTMVVQETPAVELTREWIAKAKSEMAQRFDQQNGGFGGAPKFPHSMDLSLLMRHYKNTQETEALDMAEYSLRKMANGGMYDQLGGGFHRYSVDAEWLIPHFEKMLYDNALLAKTYLEAFQLTKNSFYETIARQTLDYVLREMVDANGGIYSSQDADTEAGEGAFFVWTPNQIHEAVDDETGKIVCQYFGVEEGGNFEHGTSVLHVAQSPETMEKRFQQPWIEISQKIEDARQKLLQVREQREKPLTDTKVLTDWNGLMISALAFAGNVLDEPRYTEAAQNACRYLLKTHRHDNSLLHTSKDGKAHTLGFLSDYAFFANGLLDTYEASRDTEWLIEAKHIADEMLERFWDTEHGGFYFTEAGQKDLIARSKSSYDSSIPSGNSIAILVLVRLAEVTGKPEYKEKAEQGLLTFSDSLQKLPSAFSQMMAALDFYLAPPKTVVLAAAEPSAFTDFQQLLFKEFIPNKNVVYRTGENAERLETLAAVAKDKTAQDGKTTAYVCENFTCKPPVNSAHDLLQQLAQAS